jgi:PAS domain S-box-containing protein
MPTSNQPRNREGRAAAERVLREIEAHNGPFVAAVQAARAPMVVTDPQISGNPIIFVNDAFVRMCGYDRDDVLGQDYFFLIGQHANPEVAERVKAAMATPRDFIEDVLFHTRDGHDAWVSMFVSPVIEEGRVVQHFASSSTSATGLRASGTCARRRRHWTDGAPLGRDASKKPTRGYKRRWSDGNGRRLRSATRSPRARRTSATATSSSRRSITGPRTPCNSRSHCSACRPATSMIRPAAARRRPPWGG